MDIGSVNIDASKPNPHVGLLRNDHGAYGDSLLSFGAGRSNFGAWADYNNDGRLDFFIGSYLGVVGVTHVWRNDLAQPNHVPSAPASLSAQVANTGVTLSWQPSVDIETPTSVLTYNLRVGTAPGLANVVHPSADLVTGYRRLPQPGALHQPTAKLVLPAGTYYWSVQAIDSVMAGGLFAAEQTFTISAPAAGVHVHLPSSLQPTSVALNGEANARGVSTAVWFEWGETTSYGQTTPSQGISGVGWQAIQQSINGLQLGTLYHFRIVANSAGGTVYGLDQTFTTPRFVLGPTLPTSYPYGAFGDYDADNLLDLIIGGLVLHNAGGSFTSAGSSLPKVSALDWGDYDADGDLDLVLSGSDSVAATQIWRQNSGVFANTSVSLPGSDGWTAGWLDIDNDGDLDLIISGNVFDRDKFQIWINRGGTFSKGLNHFPALNNPVVTWGDYDGDGDLDLLMTGFQSEGPVTRIARNDRIVFTMLDVGLPGVNQGAGVWGDYDNDGDLDLAIKGFTPTGQSSLVWRNDGGVFVPVMAATIDAQDAKLAWGDYDNDGDLDLAFGAIWGGGTPSTALYRNDSGTFVEVDSGISGYGPLSWGDYDNDGDLDLMIGNQIWKNETAAHNHPPGAPTGLSAIVQSDRVVLSWTRALDAETPTLGLTYDLRAGTGPGLANIASPSANLATGVRRVCKPGAQVGASAWLDVLGLPVGTYYWSVQAIDAAFAGGPFASEASFTIPAGAPAVNTDPAQPSSPFTATLNGQVNGKGLVTRVWFEYGATPTYGQRTSEQTAGNGVPASFSASIVALTPAATYHYRSVASNSIGLAYGPDRSFTMPQFTKVTSSLWANVQSAAWADFDNDGDLDLALAPWGGGVQVFRNNGGVLALLPISLPTSGNANFTWGDYDNDGDLDLLVTNDAYGQKTTRIWRNTNGTFIDAGVSFPGLSRSTWGDFNNDGFLDVLLFGYWSSLNDSMQVWINDHGQFHVAASNLPNRVEANVCVIDYDLDGDLDIMILNYYGAGIGLWKNEGGLFTDSGISFQVLSARSFWGDYDSDGDLDLLLTGYSPTYRNVQQLWRNQGGAFSIVEIPVPPQTDLAWGDCNNDGLTDIVAGAPSVNTAAPYFLLNQGNGFFVEHDLGLEYTSSSVAFADYDGDHDLDVFVDGVVWRNDVPAINQAPSAPSALSATVAGSKVTFSWSSATDSQTPAAGLSYNLRVGTSPGSGNVLSPAADPVTGWNRLARPGNVISGLKTFLNLPVGTYYWSVQAIDNAFIGGAWAAERVLVVYQDSDGDGMADDWETAHGLDPQSPADGALDSDGDGQSNAAEYLAGTPPNDPKTKLMVSTVEATAQQTTLTFVSVLGKVYQLEESTVSPGGPWTAIQSNIAGTGGNISKTIADPASQTKIFYRVVVIP